MLKEGEIRAEEDWLWISIKKSNYPNWGQQNKMPGWLLHMLPSAEMTWFLGDALDKQKVSREVIEKLGSWPGLLSAGLKGGKNRMFEFLQRKWQLWRARTCPGAEQMSMVKASIIARRVSLLYASSSCHTAKVYTIRLSVFINLLNISVCVCVCLSRVTWADLADRTSLGSS